MAVTTEQLKAGAAVLAASQVAIGELQTRAQRIDAMTRSVAALQAGVLNDLVPLERLQEELYRLRAELVELAGVAFPALGVVAAGALPVIDGIVGDWVPGEGEE